MTTNHNSPLYRPLFALCLLVFVLLAGASGASARVVEVAWSPDNPEAEIKTRAQAREVAFAKAVFLEALDLLPGPLSESRQALLSKYLKPSTSGYVLSYSAVPQEVAPAAEPVPNLLRLDVRVNRTALKREVQRMGVFYTVRGLQAYDLSLMGDAAGAWEEIGQLQMLSGLTVRRGEKPLMEIESRWTEGAQGTEATAAKDKAQAPAILWTGRLLDDQNTWTAEGAELSSVWFDLWGKYFSRPGAEVGVVDQVFLAVKGWYASDGVQAFSKELEGWDGVVESALLREVVMLPDGIGAVWTVKTLNVEALSNRLDSSLAGRGLRWEYSQSVTGP